MNCEKLFRSSFDLKLKPFYYRDHQTPGLCSKYVKCIYTEDGVHHYIHCIVYANGRNESEKGYISIFFQKEFENYFLDENVCPPRNYTLTCTISLKDKGGNLRIPQSLVFFTDFQGRLLNDPQIETFGLEKFISREFLSLNKEEFLTKHGLFFHCDFEIKIEYYTVDAINPIPIPKAVMLNIQQFLGKQKLKIDFNSPEFQVLSKYEYFQIAQNICMKEAENQYIEIDQAEFPAFINMVYCAKNKNIDHIFTLKQLLKLYTISDMYQITDVFKMCVDELKQCMTPKNAFIILKLSTECGDKVLEEFATEYIYKNPESLMSKFHVSHIINDFDINDSLFYGISSPITDTSDASNYVLHRHFRENSMLDCFE